MPPDPLRGEVWLVDLGMAAKTRPCLILNPDLVTVTLVGSPLSGPDPAGVVSHVLALRPVVASLALRNHRLMAGVPPG
jgi:mRNA-degrading endonuclease toxin of MazEF toxin-antitoxin module